MKTIVLLIFGLLLLKEQSFCQDKDTLIGKVISINNPCPEYPCLPGGVLALKKDGISYILTINHLWNVDTFNVDGRFISVDDSMQVIGVIYEKVDINNKTYYELEIEKAFFFDITKVVDYESLIITIFPNPTAGCLIIQNTDESVSSIHLIDLEGKMIFCKENINSSNIVID